MDVGFYFKDIGRKVHMENIRKAVEKGLLHIFSANFINKIIQFGTVMFLVKVLNKESYGQFSYAQNILNIFLLLQGFGAVYGILQYCSEKKDIDEKLSNFKFGVIYGIVSNVILCSAIFISSIFFKLKIDESNKILTAMAFIPLLSVITDMIISYLRAELRNKQYSLLLTINTAMYFCGNLGLGMLFGVNGVVISMYIAYIVSISIGIYLLRDRIRDFLEIKIIKKGNQLTFIKFSLFAIITNSVSQLLYLVGTFFVGLFISSPLVVASYKVATLIPFNLAFIPNSLCAFIYPYFAQNCNNKEWIKNKYEYIEKKLMVVNGAISIILIAFAPLVIKIMFGKEYMDTVTPFRILMVGYFISGTFRMPAGNILFSIKKLKINFYNAIITGVSNIILNIVLIRAYGVNGAAIAILIVYIIASLISNGYLRKYLKE